MPTGASDKEETADGIEGCAREFAKCSWQWSERAEREDKAQTRSAMVWGTPGAHSWERQPRVSGPRCSEWADIVCGSGRRIPAAPQQGPGSLEHCQLGSEGFP